MAKKKYYCVWVGVEPGVYDNWEDAAEQVLTYPGAKYKSFPTREAALRAFRGDDAKEGATLLKMIERPARVIDYSGIPEIKRGAWAVDAACSGNPGPLEYRCVEVDTGLEIFSKSFPYGTNNIGEYLAIVHAMALLERQGDSARIIYSDSLNAMEWVGTGHQRSLLKRTPETEALFGVMARADRWLATHSHRNPLLKWDTKAWGEIPADFGRK